MDVGWRGGEVEAQGARVEGGTEGSVAKRYRAAVRYPLRRYLILCLSRPTQDELQIRACLLAGKADCRVSNGHARKADPLRLLVQFAPAGQQGR